jgi:uncharacterized repeat protein (TIGR01451 family)
MHQRHALSSFVAAGLVFAAILVLAAAPAAAQEADLFVLKEDSPDPVPPGGTLTYTITVLNNGPDDALFVSLDDTLPAEVTFTSLSFDPAWSCSTPPVGSGGTISCSIASLPVGLSSFTLVVAVDSGVALGTSISNTASLGSETPDPNPGNESATATTTVGLPPPSSNLAVAKSGAPNPVAAGSDLVYTITVTNNGPDPATGVTLIDNLPPETTFVSSSEPAGWSCTPPAVPGDAVNCTNPSLAVGSEVLTLTVNVNPGTPDGTVLLNAVVVSAGNASDPASTTAKNTVGGLADYSVTKTDSPDPVDPGSNLTYTITAGNAGPASVPDATVSDPLPAETTFVSLVAPPGWSCSTPTPGSGGTVSCINASFAPGSAVFTLVVQVGSAVPDGTVVSNTATITSPIPDSNPGDTTATATTTVQGPQADYSVAKTDSPDPVDAGAHLTYTITATNAGPDPAADTTVSDPLPAGTTLVSLVAPPGWTCSTPPIGSGGTVSCTNPSFAPGSAVFTLVVQVGSAVPGGTVLSNTVTITSSTPDADSGDTTATATTTVLGQQPVAGIPTVDGRGLLALAGLFAALGAWWLRRPRLGA